MIRARLACFLVVLEYKYYSMGMPHCHTDTKKKNWIEYAYHSMDSMDYVYYSMYIIVCIL